MKNDELVLELVIIPAERYNRDNPIPLQLPDGNFCSTTVLWDLNNLLGILLLVIIFLSQYTETNSFIQKIY